MTRGDGEYWLTPPSQPRIRENDPSDRGPPSPRRRSSHPPRGALRGRRRPRQHTDGDVPRARLTSPVAIGSVALVACGLAAWFASLPAIDLDTMTDLGLASVMPPLTWAGMALVTAGFAAALLSGRTVLLVLSVAATIVVLHGLGILAEPTMRFVVAWRHVGIADHIATHGTVVPEVDAYFNWPGFFILSAFASSVLGMEDISPVARWAPLGLQLMYLPPMVVIGRVLVREQRLVWLGIWLFFVADWIGQDYYSPQGLSIFMYLVVLAVLLGWFASPSRAAHDGLLARTTNVLDTVLSRLAKRISPRPVRWSLGARHPAFEATGAQAVALFASVLAIVVAVVASHQLTPFMLVLSTVGLVAVGCLRLTGLPLIVVMLNALWVAYMAVAFLEGHLQGLIDQVGALGQSVNQNVGGRLEGSPEHELVVQVRLASTAALWLAAAVGFVRLLRAGRPVRALAVLALAPFPLLVMQPYGGEVLLRIGLLSLPFMSFLAAAVFLGRSPRATARRAVAGALVLGGLMVAVFPVTRWGNERMDYYTPAEVAGTRALYAIAPPGSVLVAAVDALPWKYTRYAQHEYRFLSGPAGPAGTAVQGITSRDDLPIDLDEPDPDVLVARVVERLHHEPGQRAFLVITRSQRATLDIFGPWERGALARLEMHLLRAPSVRTVFRNEDVTIFEPRGAA